jgi:hypothetical protein
MQIYQSEINDGLEHTLSSVASITFASLAEPSLDSIAQKTKTVKAIASLNDSDLYYVQSILVTSSWNKNDDIFDKKEIWLARETPSHKPTNLEHDENNIVGHIVANWPMTEDGLLIDENTDINNLPEKYHILTASVIYRAFSNPELQARANNLIAEVESGQKYVSMECFFKGFDYGLTDKSTGEYKVLARGEDTAYLTKYLRAYGGVGEHENYKIGRVLRQITFSGKGFVDKPANPDSIIFSKDDVKSFSQIDIFDNDNVEKNTISEEEGVFSNQANLKEINIMNSDNATPETETITEQDSLVAEIASLNEQIKELQQSLAAEKDVCSELASLKAELDSTKAALDTANEVVAAYKMKEEEMMKKEKKMKRMASLVNSGIETETAEATVEKFDALDDDAFEAMTSLLAAQKSKMKDMEKKEETEEKKEMASESTVDASVLENVEVETETEISVGTDTAVSETENTRAALIDFVCQRLGKKLNKGE